MRRYGFPNCNFIGSVVFDLASENKFDAFDELINKAPVFSKIKDKEKFLQAVLVREKERCTGFNHGVAVAHGQSDCVKKISVALGISKKGIDYNSPDKLPVNLLFLIATPLKNSSDYLSILSILMSITHDDKLRDKILNSQSIESIEHFLKVQFSLACKEKKR